MEAVILALLLIYDEEYKSIIQEIQDIRAQNDHMV